MHSKKIESLLTVLPLLKELTGQDMRLGLCDTETCIGIWEAEGFRLPGGIRVGDKITKEFGVLTQVLESGKTIGGPLPKEVLGIPVMDIVTPIYEDGELVGLVMYTSSREEKVQIVESSQILNESLHTTQSEVEVVTDGINSLAETINNINDAALFMQKQAEKVSGLIRSIEGSASKSNILALNASIEAARVGEAGKGFSVVANEMGKLAKLSGHSAKEISESLSDIFKQLNSIANELAAAQDVASTQSNSVSEIKNNLTNITQSSQNLQDFLTKE